MKRTLLSFFAVVTMIAAVGCEPSRETRENIVHTPETTTATATSATTTAGVQATAPVQVTLSEYSIEMPATLPAGRTRFEIRNAGQLPHNFEIEGQGIEEELEEDLAAGQSGVLEVDLQPGTYRVYCPVGNHDEEHGMTTELTVTQGPGAGDQGPGKSKATTE
jgi:uncharacterized cupredoxin-like copper-binding protein